MKKSTRNRLLSIQAKLDKLSTDLTAVMATIEAEERAETSKTNSPSIEIKDVKRYIAGLKKAGRDKADSRLKKRNKAELVKIGRELLISGQDLKRNKDTVRRKILYELFDFHRNHRALRD